MNCHRSVALITTPLFCLTAAICWLAPGSLCSSDRTATADESHNSALWGSHGELWSPTGRLPDFSYAGYLRGEQPLPTLQPERSVKEFGAVGDGETDDTAAFQLALREMAGKTIAVPPGVYVIRDILRIDTSGTSLKGAGSRQSVLRFPLPLNDIQPNWGATTTGQRTSNYSWSGGFLSVTGSIARRELARVVAEAQRGATSLFVSDVESVRVGDDIRLQLCDTDDQSLSRHLYADDPGPIDNLGSSTAVQFHARITHVDQELKRIDLDRPLRTDVKAEWNPQICAANSSVENVGIEDLGFEFPDRPYLGHFTELGYNALAMTGVRNCWARNLWIHNADSGIFINGTNITIEGVEFESERKVEPTRKATGHHGITLGGQDNLLIDFDFHTRFMHDITVSRGSAGNVAARGKGIDLCFDHHRYAPHANLFTDIDLGEGSRMFQSGGGAKLGRHSGAWETFWAIRARRPQSWPADWGPDRMNLVGLTSADPATVDSQGRWFEPINPASLAPSNLYEAQLERRMKTTR